MKFDGTNGAEWMSQFADHAEQLVKAIDRLATSIIALNERYQIEIQREADRIVETAPVTLTEWPKEVPEGRWVYYTMEELDGVMQCAELTGEFRRMEGGSIVFDEETFLFSEAEFRPGEKFVKLEAGE